LFDAGHARDGPPVAGLFAHEKREDEIVRAQAGLAHEIAQGARAAETARASEERSHPPRLSARFSGRKQGGAAARRPGADLKPPLLDDKPSGPVFVPLVSRRRDLPNEKQNYLLIDISNSFTKLAPATHAKLGASKRIATARLNSDAIAQQLSDRPIDRVIVSSVVPEKDKVIRRAAGKIPILFVSAKCELGVGVDYPRPASIGGDRLANAAAVAALYGCPAVVVDFGTAVTFDVVSTERCYIGGVIAPGLEAMTTYLYNRTALLPKLNLAEPRRALGRTTRDAMMSGAIFGYRGLVKEILARLTAEVFGKRKARVVATGGYAGLIAARLPEIDEVRPDLTLEGLRIIGNLNR
jgi:type III pantothenate kinase